MWPGSSGFHTIQFPGMYIAIEGVIGVGKTSLARLLGPVFHADFLLEVFEANPFLSDFYDDRDRYAFQTQIFFLLSRYHQQRHTVQACLKNGTNLISDYTFDKDSLFARINLVGDELEMYYQVHAALAEKIARPDLIVYLQADTSTLLQRIMLRDRSYERNMDFEYIHQLNDTYNAYFASYTQSNLLVIDTNHMDFVLQQDHLKHIETRIRQALKFPPYQEELLFQPSF